MRLLRAGATRATVVLVGWIAAAVVAGFIGIAAIGAVGDGIVGTSSSPLSAEQVDQQLAAQGTAPGTATAPAGSAPGTSTPPPSTIPQTSPPGGATVPPATQPPAPPAESETKSISTQGGSILTRCRGASPQIVNAVPAQGYSVEKDADEGEGRARVEFESDDVRVRVEIFCDGGEPVWTIGD